MIGSASMNAAPSAPSATAARPMLHAPPKGHKATHVAAGLMAIVTKARRLTHPYRPREYSLIIRQDGSYSGSSTCRIAISAAVIPPATSAVTAAMAATVNIGLPYLQRP